MPPDLKKKNLCVHMWLIASIAGVLAATFCPIFPISFGASAKVVASGLVNALSCPRRNSFSAASYAPVGVLPFMCWLIAAVAAVYAAVVLVQVLRFKEHNWQLGFQNKYFIRLWNRSLMALFACFIFCLFPLSVFLLPRMFCNGAAGFSVPWRTLPSSLPILVSTATAAVAGGIVWKIYQSDWMMGRKNYYFASVGIALTIVLVIAYRGCHSMADLGCY